MTKALACLGCGVPTERRGGRCSACAGERDSIRNRVREVYRDPRWEPLRRLVIGEHRARWGGICLGLPGDRPSSRHLSSRSNPLTVDHILPVWLRPDLAFVRSNLQVLCKSCNDRKGSRIDVPATVRSSGLPRRRSAGVVSISTSGHSPGHQRQEA